MHKRHDYLYVDRRRINSYYEQLNQPDRTEHLSKYSVALQNSGGEGGSSQESSVCSSDVRRKAAFVLYCLTASGHLAGSFSYEDLSRDFICGQPGHAPQYLYRQSIGGFGYAPFVYARLQATRVLFPFTLDVASDNPGIAVWLHCNRETINEVKNFDALRNVWMLEEFSGSDVAVRSPRACIYSALEGIIKECFREFSRTVLGKHAFVRDLKHLTFTEFQSSHRETLDKLMYENAVDVATELGGNIACSTREVEVLCRVRDYFVSSTMGTHVFAIAIFVRTT